MARRIEVGVTDVGAGPTVLLIHGHPFDRSMWDPQLSVAEHGWRVLVPDLRGYGQGAAPGTTTSFENFVGDLTALLDARGIGSVVAVGLSMGGQIAMEFVRHSPARVRGLVLAATTASAESDRRRRARVELADRLEEEGVDDYARELLPKMLAPDTITADPRLAARVLDMMRAAPPAGAAAALRGRAQRADATAVLASLEVPALVVVGSKDTFTPVHEAEAMHQTLPRSQMVVLDGTAHLPNLEAPEAFNHHLVAFLETLRAGRGDRAHA